MDAATARRMTACWSGNVCAESTIAFLRATSHSPRIGEEPFFCPSPNAMPTRLRGAKGLASPRIAPCRLALVSHLVVYDNLRKLYITTNKADPVIQPDARLWKNAPDAARPLLPTTP